MNDDSSAALLTPAVLAEALRVELRQALWEAKVELHRNTIKAIARRIAQQVVTYPSSHPTES